MALSAADLEALDAAIATGELTVEFNGRRVTYRSVDELLKARQHVASVVSAASSATPARGAFRVEFTTGRGF